MEQTNNEKHHVGQISEAQLAHPHQSLVHQQIQEAIRAAGQIGVHSQTGVAKSNFDEMMGEALAQGVDASIAIAQITSQFESSAAAQFVGDAFEAGRVSRVSSEQETESHGKVAMIVTDAIMFTPEQFGAFLVDVERRVLQAVDYAIDELKTERDELKWHIEGLEK